MKKFIAGVIIGGMASLSTAALASDSIQAYLFQTHVTINGITKDVGNETPILNINGHAYVPLRYMAENTGISVGYDDNNKTISLAYNQMNVKDPLVSSITFGDIVVERSTTPSYSNLVGHVQLDRNETSYINYSLDFLDGNGKLLGTSDGHDDFKPGLQSFQIRLPLIPPNFATVKLRIHDVRPGVQAIVDDLYKAAKYQDDMQIRAILSQVSDEDLDYVLLGFFQQATTYTPQNRTYLYPFLLETKANVNVVDKTTGYTPLMYASTFLQEMIEPLLLKGADVTIAANDGNTPLLVIASQNYPSVIKRYLALGANPNAKNVFGYTPLLGAIRPVFSNYTTDTIKSVVYLLDANASTDITEPDGRSILEYFQYFEDSPAAIKIRELLINHGAK